MFGSQPAVGLSRPFGSIDPYPFLRQNLIVFFRKGLFQENTVARCIREGKFNAVGAFLPELLCTDFFQKDASA